MPRKPNPHGLYCNGTRTTHQGPCNAPALWIIYWGDLKADKVRTDYACAYHLHQILTDLKPKAEFCQDMFRVLPVDMVMDWNARQKVENG